MLPTSVEAKLPRHAALTLSAGLDPCLESAIARSSAVLGRSPRSSESLPIDPPLLPAMPDREPRTAPPFRVLIAEDEAIVSYSVAEDLGEFGYDVVGPFDSCADALRWLGTDAPDFAVVDLMLKDGLCTDLAHALNGRGVPFLVFSGEARDGATPQAFAHAAWIEKPASIEHLVEALERMEAAAA